MKEKVSVKLIAVKEGTPKELVEKVIHAAKTAWKKTNPGETLICIPVERKQ